MKEPKDYIVYHHTDYEPYPAKGFQVVKVLPFLYGKPWDKYTLGYLQALRPSYVRVTKGCVTADARNWRVTVIIDDNNIIQSIEQEVEVGLPEGVQHGDHLATIVQCGKGSLEDQWEALDGDISSYCLEFEGVEYSDTYKCLEDGTTVSYPKEGDTELVYRPCCADPTEGESFCITEYVPTAVTAWKEGDTWHCRCGAANTDETCTNCKRSRIEEWGESQ